MRRVASLFLPSLATDRLRRLDATTGRPPDRTAEPPALPVEPLGDDDAFACSVPRGGGWRPGARWAQSEGHGAAMDDRAARIAALPAHQRPPIRELGRRSEAAEHPFKTMRADDGGAPSPSRRLRPHSASALPPLVTSARSGQKVVVAAADAGALALGLTPGMALTHARALVPGLDIRDSEPEVDRALLDRLARFAMRRWTPTAMVDRDDGILLDLTGADHLHGGEQQMARRLIRFCTRLGLQAQVSIAGTIGAAHALARFTSAQIMIVEPNNEPEALALLPVTALRLEESQLHICKRLGIDRVGDLFTMARGPLAKRLGRTLVTRLDQAIGRVSEPFVPIVLYEVPVVERRFAEPIASAEVIEIIMRELVAALIDLLRERGLGARRIRLTCDRIDGVPQIIDLGLARRTREPGHVLRLLFMKIETIEPGFGIDAVRLVATRTEPLGAVDIEGDLAGAEEPGDLSLLVDQIVTRLGPDAIYRPSAVESDVPERAVARAAVLDEVGDWPTNWPRPVRVLSRPEAIDNVLALLPDQPPRRFRWRGVNYIVARADGPERIAGEWWKRTAEAHQIRDYYRVETASGERFWVFRRGDGEFPNTGDLSWYMAGFFA